MKTKIGVYGGTFSPPHVGHIHAVKSFLAAGLVDKLLIIPTCLPPHKEKKDTASGKDRLEMCRRAFDFSDKIEVSDIEIARGGKSYTAETLRALKTEDNELYFLTGSDMFLSLPNWREPEAIFKLATIVALTRECEAEVIESLSAAAASYRERFGARTVVLPVEAIEMSSSLVREKCKNGEDCTSWVPASVLAYIEEKGLYR
jgi:nicotinate-nucleotide adenylyltransferase